MPPPNRFSFSLPNLGIAAAVILIAIYHWRFSSWGLEAGFTLDDMMNTGQSLRLSIGEMLRDIVLFFRPSIVFRPLGELWYRLIYEWFGLNPLPFRIGVQVLLAINVCLAYRFFQLVSGKVTVALLATLVVAHHHELSAFYFNTGFVFDLLCFLFYFWAANFYLARRFAGRELTVFENCAFLALLVLALDSKEMAVTLPTVLAAAELTIPGRWTWRRLAPLAIGHFAVLAFIVGRVYGPGGLPTIGSYRPEFTVETFLFYGRRFLDWYFLQRHLDQHWLVPCLLVLVVGFAAFSKDRAPRIGLAVAFFGVLPVIFIDRGLAQAYIPFAGWTLACVCAVSAIFGFVFRSRLAPVFPFAWLYFVLWTKGAKYQLDPNIAFRESRQIASVLDDLRALDLRPPRGSKILMLSDPFPESRYTTTFMLVLLNHDYTVGVDWASEIQAPDRSQYYAVLTTVDGHVRRAE